MKSSLGYIRTTSMALLLAASNAISQQAAPPSTQAAPCAVAPAAQAKPKVGFHVPQGLRKALNKETQQISKQTGIDLSGAVPSDKDIADAMKPGAPQPCPAAPAPAVSAKPTAPAPPAAPAVPAPAGSNAPYVPQ